MVADSERDANMLYAVDMFVPDPFIYMRLKDQGYVVMNDLEIERARKESRQNRVLSLSRYQQAALRNGDGRPSLAQVICMVMRERRIKKVFVPESFPFGLARELRRLGVKVKIKDGLCFPERAFKRADEVKKISAALVMAEVGLAEAMQALRNSKIGRNRQLMYRHAPLTAERLRAIIHTAVFQAGGTPCHTIVAGGRQGCDPHEEGHGTLRAHEPIVVDVFPRSQKTGYFGDITRTVVKGRASERIRGMYQSVAAAQELAFKHLRNKTVCATAHEAVVSFFDNQGYKTGRKNGMMHGFFHATGHGVGLEIHEAPRIGVQSRDVLRPGHVVTVEPGLYYPELGGVRLEDVALVTGNGPKNLTKFEKVLEI